MELAYASMKGILTFGFPLATILICYSLMFWKLWRLYSDCVRYNVGLNLLRSANTVTLKVAFWIALPFVCCWGPQNVVAYWAFFDRGFHFKGTVQAQMNIGLIACAVRICISASGSFHGTNDGGLSNAPFFCNHLQEWRYLGVLCAPSPNGNFVSSFTSSTAGRKPPMFSCPSRESTYRVSEDKARDAN